VVVVVVEVVVVTVSIVVDGATVVKVAPVVEVAAVVAGAASSPQAAVSKTRTTSVSRVLFGTGTSGCHAATADRRLCTVPAMHASRRVAGESGALLAGAVVNGLAAYGFVALGTRALGAEGFAPVAIVWAFWAFSAALLTFPIQHWVIRQMALDRHSGGVRAAAGRVTLLAIALAAGEGLIALAAGRTLFGDGSWVWPACVTAVALGTGFMGLLRGVLAGSGRYRAAAVAIGGENLIRLAVGGAVLAVSRDPRLLAAALVSGPLIALLWPRALRLDPVAGPSPSTGLVGAAGRDGDTVDTGCPRAVDVERRVADDDHVG